MKVRVGSLDRGPAVRLADLAEKSGIAVQKRRDTCTAKDHKGEPIWVIEIEGDPHELLSVLSSDPGLGYSVERHCGSHETKRRWWAT